MSNAKRKRAKEPSQTAPGLGVSGRAATIRVLGCPLPGWARWPAVLAFTFFLVKGLLWLALLMLGWRTFSET